MTGWLEALLPKSGYVAGQVIDCGDYSLRLKVNTRARRISLRIDSRTGEAVVTAPRARQLGDAVAFARGRHDWILRHRTAVTTTVFAPGLVLTVAGRSITLAERAGVISPRLEQDSLVTSGDATTYARRVQRWLRQQALQRLQAETDAYAAKLGVSGVKVSLFDARGRWGSCTPARKTIRYSWRVILAPPSVLSYLCAHEAAHLRHPDHSPRFWAEVTSLYGGDYRPARDWLKQQGQDLFRYK